MVDNVKFNQIRIDYKWQSIENVKQKTENREMGRTHTCSQMEISTRREREAHTHTLKHTPNDRKKNERRRRSKNEKPEQMKSKNELEKLPGQTMFN